MASIYKSMDDDFSGNFKVSQFHDELSANVVTSNISGANFQYIATNANDIEIVFGNSLTVTETTALNGLVSSHIPDNSKPKKNFFPVAPTRTNINSTSYQKCVAFKYAGSENIGTLDYVEIIAYKDSSITSYDVRIYDKSNGNIIAEKTGNTNDVSEIIDLGTISNVPTGASVFECQVRKTGGNNKKYVVIDEIMIYHNN